MLSGTEAAGGGLVTVLLVTQPILIAILALRSWAALREHMPTTPTQVSPRRVSVVAIGTSLVAFAGLCTVAVKIHTWERLGRRTRVSRRSAKAARSRIGRRSTGRLVDHVAESAIW